MELFFIIQETLFLYDKKPRKDEHSCEMKVSRLRPRSAREFLKRNSLFFMSEMSDSDTVDGGKVQVHGGFYLLAKRPPYYNKGVKKKNGFQERLEDLI